MNTTTDTPTKSKRGRKCKERTGKTVFIPAHLVDYVMAILAVDRANETHRLEEK